jgi:hypothetical protein
MPTRPRSDDNPLNRHEYLKRVERRASRPAHLPREAGR